MRDHDYGEEHRKKFVRKVRTLRTDQLRDLHARLVKAEAPLGAVLFVASEYGRRASGMKYRRIMK